MRDGVKIPLAGKHSDKSMIVDREFEAVFVRDLGGFSAARLVSIVFAVGLLVCLGADYHQFVLAARRPTVAAAGCALAGVILIAVALDKMSSKERDTP